MNSKKLLIGMHAGGLPFHGHTLEQKSLGGSETALLYMARELAKRGHDVKVFNACDAPGKYDGVDYFDFKTSFQDITPVAEWDVFLVSRDFRVLAHKMNHRLLGLWNHDILTDKYTLLNNSWACDFAWCLSDFHMQQFLSVAPEYRPILHKTRNGLDLELINKVKAQNIKKQHNLFVYASRPERGLDILLSKTWPKILKEVDPSAQLLITGYSTEGVILPPEIVEFYKSIDELLAITPNVERGGCLKKQEWYELLASASMVIYPTNFPEISHLVGMEAQALGTPEVTSENFALVETIGDKSNLIPYDARSDEYQTAFVARVKRLYASDHEYKRSQQIGQQHIVRGKYDWSVIAEEWENFFWDSFERRSVKNGGRNVLKNMMYKSDLLAAKWAIDHPNDTGVNLSECQSVIPQIQSFIATHHDNPDTYSEHAVDAGSKTLHRFALSLKRIKDHFDAQPFTLVDVGCGLGTFLRDVLQAFPNQVQVKGIDFSPQIIDRAGQALLKQFPDIGDPSTFLEVGDFLTLDVPEEKADCIFAGEWLEHQVDIYGALEKLEAWVKPDGLVVLTIPSGPWEALSYREPGKITRDHVSHFEFRDIEELFSGKNFKMEYVPVAISSIDGALLGNWVIWYQADHQPYGRIDYLRKFRTMRPYQSISACIIAKNEEDNMSGFLKSIRPVADEICILDTGSQDDTVSIAKKFADKIVEASWPEDFGEARNQSIALADPEADWILWGDVDERLLYGEKLKKYLNSEIFKGYVLFQQHLIADMQDVQPDTPVRIYKNHKGFKFFGCVHEHVEEALDIPIEPVLILPDVKFIHYGYPIEAVRRKKCMRNLPLLKKDREKYPNRKLGIVLMARDYLNLSQWALEENSGKVNDQICLWLMESVRLHRQYFTDPSQIYYNKSYEYYQRALIALGHNGLPASDAHKNIPFEVVYSMGAGMGGMLDSTKVYQKSVWFADREEYEEWLKTQGQHLVDELKLPIVKAAPFSRGMKEPFLKGKY